MQQNGKMHYFIYLARSVCGCGLLALQFRGDLSRRSKFNGRSLVSDITRTEKDESSGLEAGL